MRVTSPVPLCFILSAMKDAPKWLVYIFYGVEYFCILVGWANVFVAEWLICSVRHRHRDGREVPKVRQQDGVVQWIRLHFQWVFRLGALQRLHGSILALQRLTPLKGAFGFLSMTVLYIYLYFKHHWHGYHTGEKPTFMRTSLTKVLVHFLNWVFFLVAYKNLLSVHCWL